MSKRLGILMAKNNLNDIEVYSRKLDELYENNDVCNVAVTGPYDSGENSILHKISRSSKRRTLIFYFKSLYYYFLSLISFCNFKK